MQTRLALFCDRTIEAGLAATAVAVPLFFSVYSRMAFDPTKTALLRSLVLVMAVAWLARTAEQVSGLRSQVSGLRSQVSPATRDLRPFQGRPATWGLRLATCILAAAYVLSTALSIWPRGSLWGSYLRAQGTYAVLAYMALFPLALTTLRRQEQVDRLLTAALLTSFPVALYGIMQHYNLDPFRWVGLSDAVADRAISTMGNPVFMAAYLVMMIPLTVGWIVRNIAAVRQGRVGAAPGYFLVACYWILLAAQLLALLFTQTRGALVGLGVSSLLLALLLATLRRHRAQILTFTLLGIQVLLFFVILNLPNTPLEPLRKVPYLDRLGRVFELQSGSGRLRVLIWGGVLDLARSDPLRAVIGYGPETLGAAIGPHMSGTLIRIGLVEDGTIPDRAHNETLDILATTGLIGTAAYLLLFTALFYYGLKALGLMGSRRQRYAFATLWLAGGLVLSLALRAFEGTWRLAGLGVPIGMLGGLFIYLLGYNFVSTHQGSLPSFHQQVIITSLLAAMAAHFVEVQFGITVTVTRALFWIYAALMIIVSVGKGDSPEEQPATSADRATSSGRRRRRRQREEVGQPSQGGNPGGLNGYPGRIAFLYYALVMGMALLTLAFDFSAPGVTGLGINRNMLLYFAGVCIFGGVIIHAETQALGGQEVGGDWSPLVYLGTASVFPVLFAAGLRAFPTTLARGLGGLIGYHLWLLLAMLILTGWLLLAPRPTSATRWRRPWWLYVPAVALGLLVVVLTNITPLRADMVYARALALEDVDERIAFLQQALNIAPNEFQYTSLGKAYFTKARASETASQAYVWLDRAREAFERARELEPILPERIANLGSLYRLWGELSLRPEDRIERLTTAVGYFTRAAEMSPLQAALSSEELSATYLLLGEAHAVMGQAGQASAAYEMATGAAPESAWAYLAQGALRAQAGELEAAAEAVQQATTLAPDNYIAHWSLARIQRQLGQAADTGSEADRARELAPASLRAYLETVLGPLGEDT